MTVHLHAVHLDLLHFTTLAFQKCLAIMLSWLLPRILHPLIQQVREGDLFCT